MKIHSEQEMLDLGFQIGQSLSKQTASEGHDAATNPTRSQHLIELLGDVGAGKTTFTRGLASGLGISEPVTSPSFTISKSYACPDGRTLVHYDFYRLPDPGLMQDDLIESIENPSNIVVIEWATTVQDLLPSDRTVVTITYNDDGTREVSIK